ncbi:MAG TPA: hypothetical protein VN775_13145 [Opitutaceae bacterium]|nr:hypothetical protein [Opitutaceae bacterium]
MSLKRAVAVRRGPAYSGGTAAKLDPSGPAPPGGAGSEVVFLPFLPGFGEARPARRTKAAGST